MIRLPLTLRTALRLGAHPGPLGRVRAALAGTHGYNAAWDGPRIEFGHLVVALPVAEAAADMLRDMGFAALAGTLRREAGGVTSYPARDS